MVRARYHGFEVKFDFNFPLYRVGLRQPAVEVRFDDLCASTSMPKGSTEGLFTVGVDLMVKAMVCCQTTIQAMCSHMTAES
jgi:hypothetical protein